MRPFSSLALTLCGIPEPFIVGNMQIDLSFEYGKLFAIDNVESRDRTQACSHSLAQDTRGESQQVLDFGGRRLDDRKIMSACNLHSYSNLRFKMGLLQ